MTTTVNPLALTNGQQIIAIPGASRGAQQVVLACAAYPSAGTAALEYRPPGSALWRPVYKGSAVRLDKERIFFLADMANAYRVTLAGIVGGSGLVAVATDPVDAIPPGAFVGLRAITTQTYTEANVKNGVQFEASSLTAALGAGLSVNTIFTTGAKPVIIKSRQLDFDGIGITARVFRAPTFTGGTPSTPFNLNDISGTASAVTILGGATVTAPGVEFGAPTFAIGSDLQGQSVQGTYAVTGQERILRPNTVYLLQITSNDTGPQRVSSYLTWYEGDLDLP